MKVTAQVVGSYGLAKLVPGLITAAAVPLLVHAAGLTAYGTYATVWALTSLATSLSCGWIRAAALRATGDDDSALGLLPRIPLVLAALAPAVPVAGWAALITRHSTPGTAAVVGVAAVFAAVAGAYTLTVTRTQRDGKAARYAVAETIRATVGPALGLALIGLGVTSGATAILAGYAFATIVAGAVAAGPRRPLLVATDSRPALLGAYWRYGWPISLWLGASTGLVYADRFVVTVFLGPAAAGQYAAVADMVVRGTAMVASPIMMATHPAMMAAWNAGQTARTLALIRRTAQTVAGLLAACIVGAMIVGKFLLGQALPAVTISAVLVGGLALGSAVWQLGQLAHKPYELVARNRQMLVVGVAAMAATISLDLILVPALGAAGAVLALCCGACAYAVTCGLAGSRLLRQHVAAGPVARTLTAGAV